MLILTNLRILWGFPGGSVIEKLPAVQETQETPVHSLDWEDLEKDMTTHPRFLAWKSHGQRSLAGYSPQGPQELDTTEAIELHTCLYVFSVFDFSAFFQCQAAGGIAGRPILQKNLRSATRKIPIAHFQPSHSILVFRTCRPKGLSLQGRPATKLTFQMQPIRHPSFKSKKLQMWKARPVHTPQCSELRFPCLLSILLTFKKGERRLLAHIKYALSGGGFTAQVPSCKW